MKTQKRLRSNRKKRYLDQKCLTEGRYGVIMSTGVEGSGHPIMFETAIQKLRKAKGDLESSNPNLVHGEVVIDLPLNLPLILIVPATPQGDLISTAEKGASEHRTADNVRHMDDSGTGVGGPEDRLGKATGGPSTIEDTALAEAEHLAAMAAKISMAAIDVGDNMVSRAEKHGLSLEEATEELSRSPDATVSRKSYVRSTGPTQTIDYPIGGERVLGGGHKVSGDLISGENFKLRGCEVAIRGNDGSFHLMGRDDDPEWTRLKETGAAWAAVDGEEDNVAMGLLWFAFASALKVDVDVFLSEKAGTKRRRLVPVNVHNRLAIIAGARDKLLLLEEALS
ncbi:MAG: hypothetical protein NT159_19475 [Proteobacteria bacterium]|nr:hypothetical protein [Pseudomonadota bacterium]